MLFIKFVIKITIPFNKKEIGFRLFPNGFSVLSEECLISVNLFPEIGRNFLRPAVYRNQFPISCYIHCNNCIFSFILYDCNSGICYASVSTLFSFSNLRGTAEIFFNNYLTDSNFINDMGNSVCSLHFAMITHFHFVIPTFLLLFGSFFLRLYYIMKREFCQRIELDVKYLIWE